MSKSTLTDLQEQTSPGEQLKLLLPNDRLSFAMEAHDGISAIIAEKAGFEAIWASGLAISTSLGLRDANEATWSQVLFIVEFMADATKVPIVLDGDTGHGNFNTVRRLVRKACDCNVAGICLEDKVFPKMNSFVSGVQVLAEAKEFAGRIRAAKDSETKTFSVFARTEALVVGRSMSEALDRADMYASAGADAIVIHSAKTSADEVLSFAKSWGNRCPLVVIPTKYHSTPTQRFRDAGISLVIWANHSIRASVAAIQDVCQRIEREQSVNGIEGDIASLSTIFELLNYDELLSAEARYLATSGTQLRESSHSTGRTSE
jgi:phosphoenolpyruvate phosphomutase